MIVNSRIVCWNALLKSKTVIAVIVFAVRIGVKIDNIAGIIKLTNIKKIRLGLTCECL